MAGIWDDLKLGVAGLVDLSNPVNWITGASPAVGLALEAEAAEKEGRDIDWVAGVTLGTDGLKKVKAAASTTADQVGEKISTAADWAPWILGGVAVVALIGAAVVYGAPVVAAAKGLKS